MNGTIPELLLEPYTVLKNQAKVQIKGKKGQTLPKKLRKVNHIALERERPSKQWGVGTTPSSKRNSEVLTCTDTLRSSQGAVDMSVVASGWH